MNVNTFGITSAFLDCAYRILALRLVCRSWYYFSLSKFAPKQIQEEEKSLAKKTLSEYVEYFEPIVNALGGVLSVARNIPELQFTSRRVINHSNLLQDECPRLADMVVNSMNKEDISVLRVRIDRINVNTHFAKFHPERNQIQTSCFFAFSCWDFSAQRGRELFYHILADKYWITTRPGNTTCYSYRGYRNYEQETHNDLIEQQNDYGYRLVTGRPCGLWENNGYGESSLKIIPKSQFQQWFRHWFPFLFLVKSESISSVIQLVCPPIRKSSNLVK